MNEAACFQAGLECGHCYLAYFAHFDFLKDVQIPTFFISGLIFWDLIGRKILPRFGNTAKSYESECSIQNKSLSSHTKVRQNVFSIAEVDAGEKLIYV